MARRQVDRIGFRREDPSAVLVAMEALAAAGDGWLNVAPGETGSPSPKVPLGIVALFRAPPKTVLCSWVPAATGGASVGLTHGRGPGALRHLAAAGLTPPTGWRLRQDRTQGLVFELDPGLDLAEVLSWMLAAAQVLAGDLPDDHWHATVHHPHPVKAR